jgi:hypothetical protein
MKLTNSMKLNKLGMAAAACAMLLCFQPKVAWSSRAYAGALISGEITAPPSSGEIEIEHRLYHVKPKSPADKILSSLYAGESVDAVLDSTPGGNPLIISIVVHSG